MPGEDAADCRRLTSRGTRRVLVSVTLLHVALLLAGTIAQPLFEVPDERHHADMVVVVAEGYGWPAVGGRRLGAGIAIASRLLRRSPRTAENALPDRPPAEPSRDPRSCKGLPLPRCSQAPTLAELGNFDVHGGINRATQHPPLYYVLVQGISGAMAAIIPFGEELAVDQQLWMMRFASILLLAPLPLLTFVLARRLTDDRAVVMTTTAFVLLVPGLYLRSGAMINNDGLIVIITTIVVLLLLRLLDRGRDPRLLTAIGSLTGFGLLTKGLAIGLVPIVAAVVFYVARRSSDAWRIPLTDLSLTGLVAFLAGGWWWIRNIVVYRSLQPLPDFHLRDDPQSFSDLSTWALDFTINFLRSFWAAWFVGSPLHNNPLFFVALVGLGVVLFIAGLPRAWRHPRRLLPLSPLIVIIGGVLFTSIGFFLESGVIKAGQGRYLYPAIAGIAFVWSLGLSRLVSERFRSWLPFVVVFIAGVLQAYAVFRLVRGHFGVPGEPVGGSWNALLAWAPFGDIHVVAVTALAVGSYAAALLVTASWARRPRGEVVG